MFAPVNVLGVKSKLLRALLAYSVVGAGITVAPAAYFGGQLATFAFLLVALLVLPLLQGRSGAGPALEMELSDSESGDPDRDAGGSPGASATSNLPTDINTVLTLYVVGVVAYCVAALAILR